MSRAFLLLLLTLGATANAADPTAKGPPATGEIAVLVSSFDQAIIGGPGIGAVRDNQILYQHQTAGTASASQPFGLTGDADVDAYDSAGYVSFSHPVELPGSVYALPGDLVRFDGGSFSIAVSAVSLGLPEGINLDAATVVNGNLAVSFDQTANINGTVVQDEDLVVLDGSGCSVGLFDSSALGIDPGLDLDAAHYLDGIGAYLISFDATGILPEPAPKGGGGFFRDTTVLLWSRAGGWSEYADLGSLNTVAGEYDLNALSALGDDMFMDGFEDPPMPKRASSNAKGCG